MASLWIGGVVEKTRAFAGSMDERISWRGCPVSKLALAYKPGQLTFMAGDR